MATGGGRAGPEHWSRDAASPAQAPKPRLGSPVCGAGLAPFGVTVPSSPSSRPPSHRDPGPAGGSSSSWGTGGAAMAGGAPALRLRIGGAEVRCAAGGRSLLLPPPGLEPEAAVSAPPPPLPLRPPAARRSPAPAPPRPCPRSRPAPPRRGRRPRSSSRPAQPPLPRCSRACYYAGENGLPSPRLPRHTAAPGLQQAPIRDVPDPLEASSPLGKNQREDEQVEAAPSGSVTEQARRPRNS